MKNIFYICISVFLIFPIFTKIFMLTFIKDLKKIKQDKEIINSKLRDKQTLDLINLENVKKLKNAK